MRDATPSSVLVAAGIDGAQGIHDFVLNYVRGGDGLLDDVPCVPHCFTALCWLLCARLSAAHSVLCFCFAVLARMFFVRLRESIRLLVLCVSFKSLTAAVLAWVPGRCTRAVPSTARASAAPNGTHQQTILCSGKRASTTKHTGSDRFLVCGGLVAGRTSGRRTRALRRARASTARGSTRSRYAASSCPCETSPRNLAAWLSSRPGHLQEPPFCLR